MEPTAQDQKAALRLHIRDWLGRVPAEVRSAASQEACGRLLEKEQWREASTVLLYKPLPDEIDVEQLRLEALRCGKHVALPAYDSAHQVYEARLVEDPDRDLRPGRFGILEPAPNCRLAALNQLDLVLVPGVAFSLDGRRLGRGKGYYDRLLASVRGIRCGIAFEQQIVKAIPAEPHDMRMDYLLTPARWIRAGQGVVLK